MLDVKCPGGAFDELNVAVTDIRAAEGWIANSHTIFVGRVGLGCELPSLAAERTAGSAQSADGDSNARNPYIRKYVKVLAFDTDGVAVPAEFIRGDTIYFKSLDHVAPIPGVVKLSVLPANPQDCFEDISLEFARRRINTAALTAPGGSYGTTANAQDGAEQHSFGPGRRLGWWSKAVSWVEDAAAVLKRALDAAMNFLNSLKWELNEDKTYHLFEWNYDRGRHQASDMDKELIEGLVRCTNCYAYLDFDFHFKVKGFAWNLQVLEVIGTLSSQARFEPYTRITRSYEREQQKELWSDGNLARFNFMVGPVPVWITLGAKVGVGGKIKANADIFIAYPSE